MCACTFRIYSLYWYWYFLVHHSRAIRLLANRRILLSIVGNFYTCVVVLMPQELFCEWETDWKGHSMNISMYVANKVFISTLPWHSYSYCMKESPSNILKTEKFSHFEYTWHFFLQTKYIGCLSESHLALIA